MSCIIDKVKVFPRAHPPPLPHVHNFIVDCKYLSGLQDLFFTSLVHPVQNQLSGWGGERMGRYGRGEGLVQPIRFWFCFIKQVGLYLADKWTATHKHALLDSDSLTEYIKLNPLFEHLMPGVETQKKKSLHGWKLNLIFIFFIFSLEFLLFFQNATTFFPVSFSKSFCHSCHIRPYINRLSFNLHFPGWTQTSSRGL